MLQTKITDSIKELYNKGKIPLQAVTYEPFIKTVIEKYKSLDSELSEQERIHVAIENSDFIDMFINKPEFKKSAIKFFVNNEEKIYTSSRHHEIIKKIHDDGFTAEYKKFHFDGFIVKICGKEQFIDRDEATKLAKKYYIPMQSSILTSEDLW